MNGCVPYVERNPTARKWNRLLFGDVLLANQGKVTRAARRAERNALGPYLAFQEHFTAAGRNAAVAGKPAPTGESRDGAVGCKAVPNALDRDLASGTSATAAGRFPAVASAPHLPTASAWR
jgi:hypothetical protein